MISFSDQECEIFTGKINRPLCDMLCAAPEFLHNGFNFFLKYFYAPVFLLNILRTVYDKEEPRLKLNLGKNAFILNFMIAFCCVSATE